MSILLTYFLFLCNKHPIVKLYNTKSHFSVGFQNFMVPKKGLEPLHLTATASKTVMSTIPSPGHYFWIYQPPSCTPLECRPALRRLVLGSMAPYGRTSTIPSPGHYFYGARDGI